MKPSPKTHRAQLFRFLYGKKISAPSGKLLGFHLLHFLYSSNKEFQSLHQRREKREGFGLKKVIEKSVPLQVIICVKYCFVSSFVCFVFFVCLLFLLSAFIFCSQVGCIFLFCFLNYVNLIPQTSKLKRKLSVRSFLDSRKVILRMKE